tara:strand:+ start:166 stop:735 length:570 start_codon:yes stop_codon:yes gene_type:complete
MLEIRSENRRTPLTRADISEFLMGLGGIAVVHEKVPETVEVKQSFRRLKDSAIPVKHQPQRSHDIQQCMYLFLESQMFLTYETERRRIGRELTDEEMFQNNVDTMKSFRFYHGWALFESNVWIPHVWVCAVDPMTIEPTQVIEVGDEAAVRYVGTGIRLFDAANINDEYGHRTPDDARQALLALREVRS